MAITAAVLKQLIAQELGTVADQRVQAHVRSLLVEPTPILRDWDYGQPRQQYACWGVLNHDPSNTGIAYCEEGFGPQRPWGLVHLSGEDRMSIGMDSGWFETFMDAYFDSFAPTDLPIWRVFKTSPETSRLPISEEQNWRGAWAQIEELRARDPESRYDCDHSITYGRLRAT
jgi:hypothetical protein